MLYRPEGPGPFPAVVALHGCGGLVNRSGKVFRRFADWGDRLAAAGLAVLFPDSFTSRGLTDQCRVRARKVRSSRERVADARRRGAGCRTNPGGQGPGLADRLGERRHRVAVGGAGARAGRATAMPDFRSAVAFYPGCRRLGEAAWAARIPTLILIGRADDWTPAAACEQMVAGARGRTRAGLDRRLSRRLSRIRPAQLSGARAERARLQRRRLRPCPCRHQHRPARADALKRVPEWLMR